ncbi:MAG: restriction endonuclease, partial [Acidobacteria bacterium]|nr:restriction endonuclease [Acidobacteriota bacterium]
MQISGSNDENLTALLELLQERNLYNYDLRDLRFAVKEIENQIELENFEKRLNEGNEQIFFENIDQLNGYEFEDFLKTLFSKMGYQVEQTRLSGDQGADLVIVKFGEKTVIQAKRFGGKVGNKAVQEIMAAISLYEAQKGMVITNNYFTPAAVK